MAQHMPNQTAFAAPSGSATARDNLHLEIAVRSLLSPTQAGRSENQDNFLIIDAHGLARFLWREKRTQQQLANWPAGHQRVAVLDGMGGHSHGREATEKTIAGLLRIPACEQLEQLSSALDALHCDLHHEFREAGLETGCTLLLLEIPPQAAPLLFHVGDSRLYAIDAHQADCLTVDHVPATHLAILGLLDGKQWLQQVHVRPGSQISQAFVLGSTLGAASFDVDSIDTDLYALDESNLPAFLHGMNDRRRLHLEPEQVYLLASDGLWHLRHPQAFIQSWPRILAQPQRSLEALLDELFAELARHIIEQDYQPDDNTTVILLRLAPTSAAA